MNHIAQICRNIRIYFDSFLGFQQIKMKKKNEIIFRNIRIIYLVKFYFQSIFLANYRSSMVFNRNEDGNNV